MGVSAVTGEGMDDFFAAVASCARDYEQHYLPELQRRQQVRSPACINALASHVFIPAKCQVTWKEGHGMQVRCDWHIQIHQYNFLRWTKLENIS